MAYKVSGGTLSLYSLTDILSMCVEMSCLMSAMKDSSVHLRPDCRKQMEQRIQLWNAAVKVVTELLYLSDDTLLGSILSDSCVEVILLWSCCL